MAHTADTGTVPAGPFSGPALWYGPDLARREEWITRLTAAHRGELLTALRTARGRAATLLGMTRVDFPLPDLAARLGQVTAELRDGPGFALIRGVPVDRLGEAEASTVLRGIGQYLGRPVSQTVDGRTLCHVREADPRREAVPQPAHRTRAALPFHTDESDISGLLCLRQARSGGRTLLASAAAVHNAVLDTRPDLAGRLYDVRFFAQHAEPAPGERSYLAAPLIARHGTRPSMRYDRPRLDAGENLVQDTPAHGPDASSRTLYDVIEATAASPALRLDIDLRPGDLLLLDNHVVLHARTAFEDFTESGRKRHLLRLWLARHDDASAPDGPADLRAAPHTRGGVTPHDVIRPRPLRPALGGCGHPAAVTETPEARRPRRRRGPEDDVTG